MAYIAMAYIAMAYIAMAYLVMAYIVMAHVGKAYKFVSDLWSPSPDPMSERQRSSCGADGNTYL